MDICRQSMCLLFNTLSTLVITFIPRSKYLLISWLQSPSAVILEPPKIKPVIHYFHCFPIYLPWSDRNMCHDLPFFLMLSFKPAFSLYFLSRGFSSRGSLVLLCFLPWGWKIHCSVISLSEVIYLSPSNLIPACASSRTAFHMMYSAYKLISRMIIYSLGILLFRFGTSLLFHVQF